MRHLTPRRGYVKLGAHFFMVTRIMYTRALRYPPLCNRQYYVTARYVTVRIMLHYITYYYVRWHNTVIV